MSSDYNQRQYKMMSETLEAYQAHRVSLSKCISNLKGLIACLQEPPEKLKAELEKNWLILEEVFAVSEDEGLSELSTEYKTLVAKATDDMKRILQPMIDLAQGIE